jgi:hypothetical protein
MPEQTNRFDNGDEGLPLVRFSMVLSSLAPLFVLWAIRGMRLVPDMWLVPACAALVVVPNLHLALRVRSAKQDQDKGMIDVKAADDHRDHLLVYLFAMLVPLFDANVGSERDSAATLAALMLVIFLFWHLNLHYMNLLFAVFGYRVFTVRDDHGTRLLALLTKRSALPSGTKVDAYRLSNTVYIEL